jgi:hypothetical protein
VWEGKKGRFTACASSHIYASYMILIQFLLWTALYRTAVASYMLDERDCTSVYGERVSRIEEEETKVNYARFVPAACQHVMSMHFLLFAHDV